MSDDELEVSTVTLFTVLLVAALVIVALLSLLKTAQTRAALQRCQQRVPAPPVLVAAPDAGELLR